MKFIFDLDGTIIDSSPGIVNGLKKAFDSLGVNYRGLDLNTFIGPPLERSFSDMGLGEKSKDALLIFRDYYYEFGRRELKLYDGIREMIMELKTDKLIATSKPEDVSKMILRDLNILDDFKNVVGAKGAIYDKSEILKSALRDERDAIMIGDRYTDISAAKELGIKSVAVLYGFGTHEELKASNPDEIATDVAELLDILKGYENS